MAAIVQRLERQIVVLDVEGSIPSSRPIKSPLLLHRNTVCKLTLKKLKLTEYFCIFRFKNHTVLKRELSLASFI